jgi:hypothetical protein
MLIVEHFFLLIFIILLVLVALISSLYFISYLCRFARFILGKVVHIFIIALLSQIIQPYIAPVLEGVSSLRSFSFTLDSVSQLATTQAVRLQVAVLESFTWILHTADNAQYSIRSEQQQQQHASHRADAASAATPIVRTSTTVNALQGNEEIDQTRDRYTQRVQYTDTSCATDNGDGKQCSGKEDEFRNEYIIENAPVENDSKLKKHPKQPARAGHIESDEQRIGKNKYSRSNRNIKQ